MPTFADVDPTKLPAYPDAPHKTGQARVFVDRRSQYLGKFGTTESHALYHLLCVRMLLDGTAPSTKELRDELRQFTGSEESVEAAPCIRAWLQASALVVILLADSFIGFYATWSAISAVVTVERPQSELTMSTTPLQQGTAADAIPRLVPRTRLASIPLADVIDELNEICPDRSVSDLYEEAAARIRRIELSVEERSDEESDGDERGTSESNGVSL